MSALVIGAGPGIGADAARSPEPGPAPGRVYPASQPGRSFGQVLSHAEGEAPTSDERQPSEPEARALSPDQRPANEAAVSLADVLAGACLEPSVAAARDPVVPAEAGAALIASGQGQASPTPAGPELAEPMGSSPVPAAVRREGEARESAAHSTELPLRAEAPEPAPSFSMPATSVVAVRPTAASLELQVPTATAPSMSSPEVSTAGAVEPLEFAGEVLHADETGAELEIGEGRERLHLFITTRDGAVEVRASGASAELGALLLVHRDQLGVALEAQGLALSGLDFYELDEPSNGAREGEDPDDSPSDEEGPERSRDGTRARSKLALGRGRIFA